MRRIAIFLVGGAIWLLLLAIPAMADGGPHVRGQANNAATGSCAACHRAHSGQAKDLLKASASTLCYTCHGVGGTGATTDVSDGVAYEFKTTVHASGPGGIPVNGGALRGGGFQYALIATNTLAGQPSGVPSNGSTLGRMVNVPVAATSAATTSAHSVDGSDVTMWGAGVDGTAETGKADVQLTCASCHDPHGNGQYRILKPTPDDADLTNSTVAAVKILDPTVKSYVTTSAVGGYGVNAQVAADVAESPLTGGVPALSYDVATKTFSGTYLEASSRWCSLCHTRYLGYAGSAGNKLWTESGTGDATFAFRHASRNIVDPSTTGAPTTGTITPLTTSTTQIRQSGTSDGTYNYTNLRIGNLTSGGVITAQGVAIITRTPIAGGASTDVSAIISAPGAGDLLSNGGPRCITCHVGHGSNADAGDTTDLETSLVTGGPIGSTLLRVDGRTVCQACHAK